MKFDAHQGANIGWQAAEEVVAVAARLPDVEVRWGRPTPAAPTRQQLDEAEDGGAEVEPALAVSVTLHRHSTGRGGASTRVYAPRFPKVHPPRCGSDTV